MSVDKMVEESAARSDDGPHSPESVENVERIREILFGPQMREHGQRLSRIEERLSAESAELKAELRRRLDSMEAYARQEVGDLGERLRTERDERTESGTRVSQALADSMQSLERRLTESDERTAKYLRDLRQAMFDQIKRVLDDLADRITTLENLQNRHLEDLRHRSVDRFEFASVLTELSTRVRESGANGLGESDGGPKP